MKKQEVEETKERKNKKVYVAFRIFQSIFLGIFALGLSSMIGEGTASAGLPFSVFSIGSMVFGLIGALITEIQANTCEKW